MVVGRRLVASDIRIFVSLVEQQQLCSVRTFLALDAVLIL